MVLRAEAGLEYKASTTVPRGVAGEIYGIDPTKNWFQLQIEGLDILACILRDMTWVDGLLVSVKRITPREIATWPASARARTPPAVARLHKGTWVRVGRVGPHPEWFQVRIEVKVPGMDDPVRILCDLMKIIGSLAGVPRLSP